MQMVNSRDPEKESNVVSVYVNICLSLISLKVELIYSFRATFTNELIGHWVSQQPVDDLISDLVASKLSGDWVTAKHSGDGAVPHS